MFVWCPPADGLVFPLEIRSKIDKVTEKGRELAQLAIATTGSH